MSNQVEYFIPISDSEVHERHRATILNYRNLNTKCRIQVTSPACYLVKAGFKFKAHASKIGPCHKNNEYLQGWDFPDEPTTDCLAFWVPYILGGSAPLTTSEQIRFLAKACVMLGFPAHHLILGDVGLIAGLILTHYKLTGERIPSPNKYWVRTATRNSDGHHLVLGGFDDGGLNCDWVHPERQLFGDEAHSYVGVLALGLEPV